MRDASVIRNNIKIARFSHTANSIIQHWMDSFHKQIPFSRH